MNGWAVVLGGSATALAVVRELSERLNCRIAVVAPGKQTATVSRCVDAVWLLDSPQELLQRLHTLETDRAHWLIPTADVYIEWLAELADQWPPQVRAWPSYLDGSAMRLMDKAAFAELIAEHSDFQQPLTVAGDAFEPHGAHAEAFPVFAKPRMIHLHKHAMGGRKGEVLADRGAWREWANGRTDLGEWLVQEIITGPESNIMLTAAVLHEQGQVVHSMSARKLRQYPPGFGSASRVVSEHDAALLRRSNDFLARAGMQGLCCGEFKWCEKRGDWVVIEYNPRPALWYHVVAAAGHDLVTQAVTRADGSVQRIEDTRTVLWCYGLKDLYSAWFYRWHGRSFIFPAPEIKAHVPADAVRAWAVWRWRDPRPALAEVSVYLRKALRRLLRR